jgi:hypothetical protein
MRERKMDLYSNLTWKRILKKLMFDLKTKAYRMLKDEPVSAIATYVDSK